MLSSGLLLMSVIESEVMFTLCCILSCFTFFCKGHLNTGSLTFKKANKQKKTYQIFLKGKREVYTLCKFIIFWFCFVMSMPFSCFFQWEQDCFVLDSPVLPPTPGARGAGGGGGWWVRVECKGDRLGRGQHPLPGKWMQACMARTRSPRGEVVSP